MNWLDDNLWLAWLAGALVLVAVEAATVDFVFLMVAGGMVAGGIAAALGAPLVAQVIVAVVLALALLVVVRPLIKRQFSTTTDHRIGASGLTGQLARVVQTVTETDGRVRLNGETWSARVPDGEQPCEPGDEVRVLAIEGATALVTHRQGTSAH
ncbi:NfeD family protein [Janibacter sp. G56]